MQNNKYFQTDEFVNEALIKIADNRNQQLFGNVVIFAGGSGSGKGFIIDNLLDIQGKTMDVDKLKSLALKSPIIRRRIKNSTDIDILNLDLKKPEHTFILHQAIKESGLKDQFDIMTFSSIITQPEDRKPNIIFDVTMKNIDDLQEISFTAEKLGYKKENIHIIWVVNDIETAKIQNKTRDRTVPEKVLELIHLSVAVTLRGIINYGKEMRSFFDGKMFLVFNNRFSDDVELLKSNLSGFFIKNAKYMQIKKRKGEIEELNKETIKKIEDYTKTNFTKS
jgi:predicted kinase